MAAVDRVGWCRVSEQLAFGTSRRLPTDAVITVTAGGIERNDDLERRQFVQDLLHQLVEDAGSSRRTKPTLLLSARHAQSAYLIANIELFDSIAFLDNLTYELMATDKIRWALEVTPVEVQI